MTDKLAIGKGLCGFPATMTVNSARLYYFFYESPFAAFPLTQGVARGPASSLGLGEYRPARISAGAISGV